ncbi:KIAA1160 protein-like protein [Naegleria gruberi]|uniref:KIAA1160 protein-like protein n=1 Tax=Naegleria gruberi TaxID=5762 RepID=D2VEL4_NAEGR|nr:KIAA1160 protein-like protein [Naegleria gruberi]EFC44814.1 KIAA1160 protein-like protein [Naegleria gruberi]|eukprot:XP_002677558.1 KIAA1160 protein-like protein [Naegleria gruberi strain NEG-M]
MARNQEKAQSMLNRWTNFRIGNEFTEKKRPPHPSFSKTLNASEHWRRNVLKEIAEKVTIIQNASLGEHRIRDLNDEINRLIQEKADWEKRIIELGGIDYSKQDIKLYDDNGQIIEIGEGYKYFGAARELPGIKELLFEKQKSSEKQQKNKFNELYKGIDSFYYGYNEDEDEPDLLAAEEKAEEELRKEFYQRYLKAVEIKKKKMGGGGIQNVTRQTMEAKSFGVLNEEEKKTFVYNVQLPTQDVIEQALLEKKKQDLLKELGEF